MALDGRNLPGDRCRALRPSRMNPFSMQTSSRLSISLSAFTLSVVGIIAACSDDAILEKPTDDGGSTFADAASPNPPYTNAEDAAVAACAAVDTRTDLAAPCRSCMAASCCAQADRCASNFGCQKVIDCVENCARGASPDGSVPDDIGEGDAGEGDAGEGEGDAGDPELDDGGVAAGELDPAEVQACIEACVAPLDEELEALEELNDCQAIYCPAECPSE